MRDVVAAFAMTLVCAVSGSAQLPYLLTEGASPGGKGNIGAGVGFEYLRKDRVPAPGVPNSLWRVLVATMRHGVSENVDYDLTWRGGLFANHVDGRRDFDWGDLSIWTKIGLLKETASSPGLALQNGVKLPNTRYSPSRLGSNQMDFHSRVLVSKRGSTMEFRGNLGFSILGDPRSAGSQDDVYSLSIAVLRPFDDGNTIFAEMFGQTGYQDHDEKIVSRFGARMVTEAFSWVAYASVRLVGNHHDFATAFEHSENWSVGFFLQKSFTTSLWNSDNEENQE